MSDRAALIEEARAADELLSTLESPKCEVPNRRCERKADWAAVAPCGHSQSFVCDHHRKFAGALMDWARGIVTKYQRPGRPAVVACKVCGADLADFRWVRL